METPQQLHKNYGPAFDLGLFAPASAKVEVALAGFPAFLAQAGVYVGPDAKAWIWFSPINAHPVVLQHFLTAQGGEITVKGTLADGRNVSIQRCATAYVATNSAGGFVSFKGGNMTANLRTARPATPSLYAKGAFGRPSMHSSLEQPIREGFPKTCQQRPNGLPAHRSQILAAHSCIHVAVKDNVNCA